MGFVGRTAVHPSQLAVIADAFRPTADELSWATEVLVATAAGGVATLASGEMVDPAMRGRAESIIALVPAADEPSPLTSISRTGNAPAPHGA